MRVNWTEKIKRQEVDDMFGHYPDANFHGSIRQRSGLVVRKYSKMGRDILIVEADDGERVKLDLKDVVYNFTEK